MVRPEGQTVTDHDVVVATPPTNDNDDDGRLDQSIAEELVARAREDGVDPVSYTHLRAHETSSMIWYAVVCV